MKWEMQSVNTNIRFTDSDLNFQSTPQWTVVINQEQFEVIDMLADKSKDEDFNDIYAINDLKFKMVPYVGTVD